MTNSPYGKWVSAPKIIKNFCMSNSDQDEDLNHIRGNVIIQNEDQLTNEGILNIVPPSLIYHTF